MIRTARRAALRIFSGRKLYNFGLPERLRTLRQSIFTGGVVKVNGICSACFLRKRRRCGESFCLSQACRDAPLGQRQGGVFRLPPPYLWTPPTPQRNNCNRRQWRKQGAVVGAAASKTRVPPKARSGCWVPQPVVKGCTPLTILKKKSKHKKASAAPVGAIALTLFSLLHL